MAALTTTEGTSSQPALWDGLLEAHHDADLERRAADWTYGTWLRAIRERLAHGEWYGWLAAAEVEPRTAARYLRIAAEFTKEQAASMSMKQMDAALRQADSTAGETPAEASADSGWHRLGTTAQRTGGQLDCSAQCRDGCALLAAETAD